MLSELEAAIRAEYDEKIAALEEELERKLAACRSLVSVVSNGKPAPAVHYRAKAPGKPVRERQPKAVPATEGDSLAKRIKQEALERIEPFAIEDIVASDPEFATRKSLVDYHLRNLAARGELHPKGGGCYEPMAFNSLRPGPAAVPPSKAAPSKRPREAAAVSA